MFAEGLTLYTVAVVAMQYKVVSMATTPTAVFWFLWVISFLGESLLFPLSTHR